MTPSYFRPPSAACRASSSHGASSPSRCGCRRGGAPRDALLLEPQSVAHRGLDLFVGHAELRFFGLIEAATETRFFGLHDVIGRDVRDDVEIAIILDVSALARAVAITRA